jgi:putative FmdB family regulatory protein
MPSYSWVCPECGHAWDFIGSVKERDEHVKCPKCGAEGEFDWSSGEAPNWHFKEGIGL